ncbi:MAG: hypothetical protein P1U34_00475 [Coxiellaceae bacterium]|nr:hypothetical protein [Coxiellaceae bacterium]
MRQTAPLAGLAGPVVHLAAVVQPVPPVKNRYSSSQSSLSSIGSQPGFTGSTCCEYALAFLVVGIRLAGKVLMSYYGAKKFLEHTPSFASVALLAFGIQNLLPAVDGLQNIVMGGTSGYKTVRSLVRTPRLEFQALKQALSAHPVMCGLILLRLLGGAILRGTVIDHILKDSWGKDSALFTAFIISGLFAFSDIKFSAASDLRLLKRLDRWLFCKGSPSVDVAAPEKAKVEAILHDNTWITHSLEDALNDLSDSHKIRHFVRTPGFRDAYFVGNNTPSNEEEWRFTNTKNALVVRASHYSFKVELMARLDQLAVNLPFFYLSFLKNKAFADCYVPAGAALAWAVFSCAAKVLTSQGKPVESMCDSLSSLDKRACGKAARTVVRKPHALIFCAVGILPFSVFGAGQILGMPKEIGWVDGAVAKTVLSVFLLSQLFSYVGFIAPRVFKRVPACCCFKENSSSKVAVLVDGDPMYAGGLEGVEEGLLDDGIPRTCT